LATASATDAVLLPLTTTGPGKSENAAGATVVFVPTKTVAAALTSRNAATKSAASTGVLDADGVVTVEAEVVADALAEFDADPVGDCPADADAEPLADADEEPLNVELGVPLGPTLVDGFGAGAGVEMSRSGKLREAA